jgi:hypothetical protein
MVGQMTEVVINTDDISEEEQALLHDTAQRVERLEMADTEDVIEKEVRQEEMAARLRALEVRMEHQAAAQADSVPEPEPVPVIVADTDPEPETFTEPDPDTIEEEPDTVEEDVPEVDAPDVPDVLPDDPIERPELNPQGVADAITDDTPKRERKAREKRPVTEKRWQDFVLGGSGGARRSKHKAKAK